MLAAEIPTVQNGGVAKDGRSVTWKLKKGVTWHDGKPFTAADVVFNWEFARDPKTAARTLGSYADVEKIDVIDSHTVRLVFKKPVPFWADPFCGVNGMIIPKHLFEAYKGDKSREAPNNLKPVGTGPYKFVDFKPGDIVRGEINQSYHVPNRPFFDSIEMKGGGDAVSAARAVLQTGEYDYAWNMQVEDEILKRFEQGGRGKADIVIGGNMEHIQLNNTDPWTEVDGERSSVKSKHPFLTDPAVRQALSLLVDRASVQEQIYGRTAITTPNFLNAPARFSSKNNEVGVQRRQGQPGPGVGGLEEGGRRHPRQGRQEAQDGLPDLDQRPAPEDPADREAGVAKAGIEVEIKSVDRVGLLLLRPGEPGTPTRTSPPTSRCTRSPRPCRTRRTSCSQFTPWEVASKENKWQGRNITRWQSEEYGKLYQAGRERAGSGEAGGASSSR